MRLLVRFVFRPPDHTFTLLPPPPVYVLFHLISVLAGRKEVDMRLGNAAQSRVAVMDEMGPGLSIFNVKILGEIVSALFRFISFPCPPFLFLCGCGPRVFFIGFLSALLFIFPSFFSPYDQDRAKYLRLLHNISALTFFIHQCPSVDSRTNHLISTNHHKFTVLLMFNPKFPPSVTRRPELHKSSFVRCYRGAFIRSYIIGNLFKRKEEGSFELECTH